MMTQSKIITIDDTPDSVAGRLPGFCATNAEGIGITVEEEPAPRGLIYFRVHCGDKKEASARLELRILRGDCVIGWGWRHVHRRVEVQPAAAVKLVAMVLRATLRRFGAPQGCDLLPLWCSGQRCS